MSAQLPAMPKQCRTCGHYQRQRYGDAVRRLGPVVCTLVNLKKSPYLVGCQLWKPKQHGSEIGGENAI